MWQRVDRAHRAHTAIRLRVRCCYNRYSRKTNRKYAALRPFASVQRANNGIRFTRRQRTTSHMYRDASAAPHIVLCYKRIERKSAPPKNIGWWWDDTQWVWVVHFQVRSFSKHRRYINFVYNFFFCYRGRSFCKVADLPASLHKHKQRRDATRHIRYVLHKHIERTTRVLDSHRTYTYACILITPKHQTRALPIHLTVRSCVREVAQQQ